MTELAAPDDLLAELTLDEKIALLHQKQPAIERLGLAEFHTGQEALHGVAWSGTATVFPQAIGLGSSWNPDLLQEIGTVVAQEAREFHHGERPQVDLNFWAPVVDLLRDPRAGRNEEGYSEDPFLTGAMSTAYCRGLSGDNPDAWNTAPTLKHFFAYNNEDDRVTTSSDVRPRLLHEYYLRAFEPAIRSGAAKGVMLSYNLVNGRPAHVSPYVEEVLRTWSPDLFVVSDAFAPTNLVEAQRYFASHEESHAAALKAGLDSFTDRGPDPEFTIATVRSALAKGFVNEADIDRALLRMLRMRMALSRADSPITADVSTFAEGDASELAREAVRQSIVLLRNTGLLPLSISDVSSVAVIGPLIDDVLEDWYSGTLPYAITPLAGITERVDTVQAVHGTNQIRLQIGGNAPFARELWVYDWGDGLMAFRACDGTFLTRKDDGTLVADQPQPNGWIVHETFRFVQAEDPDSEVETELEHVASGERYPIIGYEVLVDGVAEAAEAARASDVAVVVLGNHPLVGARETKDRTNIDLPDAQQQLIRAVVDANPRTVLVVESGYPYALEWENEHVPAILWMSHGGQEAGHGLADVLFGDVSPAGRLTQTWLGSSADLEHIGGIGEYDIITTSRTYLYQRHRPLYPFGHGLSYTAFSYGALKAKDDHVSVEITNVGARAGSEVVQFYARRVSPSRIRHPNQRLFGFRRIELEPGEATTVEVPLDAATAFGHWDVRQERFVIEDGEYAVLVGGSSDNIRVRTSYAVEGEPLPPRDPFRPIRAADFDDHSGIRFVPDTPLSGDAVTAPTGGWIVFHDMDFGDSIAGDVNFVARVSGGGRLDVRRTGPTGEVLTRMNVPEHRSRVEGGPVVFSVHEDICITLQGSARLAEFWFERSQET